MQGVVRRLLAWLCSLVALSGCQGQSVPPTQPRVQDGRVIIPVVLHLAAFEAGDPPGHHLVTWSGGRAGSKALLETPVSDTAILDALERLGGKPGNTLTEATWSERDDPDDPAPDQRATGSAIELRLLLPDGSTRPVTDLLEDLDHHGYAWRLAGNRALIPVWRSGCVVCLQSCPGAKVANREATIRDLAQGHSRFRPSAWARELGEGAHLQLELRVVPDAVGSGD